MSTEPRDAWKAMKRSDPRKDDAVKAIRAVYAAAMAPTGKPFPARPLVNGLQVSKDGTRVRGRVIPMGRAYEACPCGDYEAELPGGPAPERLMDRFNERIQRPR